MTNPILRLAGLCALLLTFSAANAQTMAVTLEGDTVYLYSDGTWDFTGEFADYSIGSPLLPEELTYAGSYKSPASNASEVTGPESGYKVKYNPKEWEKIVPGEINDDASHAFQMKNDDGYAMVIFERVGIPLESLGQIAIDQAFNVAPDLNLEKAEKRTINGKEMLCLQMSGITSGIPFTYLGYYYSDENRSIQFIAFTGSNRFEVVRDQFEAMLNGLIIP